MRILGFDITSAPTPAHLLGQERAAKEARAQSSTLKEPEKWLREALGAVPTGAGVVVTEEGAMNLAAVFACVRVIAETISSLPFKLYRRDGRARHPAPEHPLYRILAVKPNPLMNAMTFRELMLVYLELWGNFYAEIQLNGRGDVVGLWPIHPRRVRVELDTSGRVPRKRYLIERVGEIRPDRMLHIPGLGFNGLVGKSPIRLYREGLGIAVSAEKYGAKFFRNDGTPGLVITHPDVLGDEGFEALKKMWNEVHTGAENAHKVAILEEGMKAERIGMPPGDAQFMDTRKFQRSEIAGIFRVKPHKIGDLERATFSNIEHESIAEVVDTFRPRCVRIEHAVNSTLLDEDEQQEYFAKHLIDGLLRGDIKTRFEAYAVGRNWGWMSANDVLELEDKNPIGPQGDVYLQPLNMVEAGDQDDGDVRAQTFARRFLWTDDRPLAGERRALPPRYRAAKALDPIFADAFERIMKREIADIRKAVTTYLEADNKAGFTNWLAEFAEQHAAWMEPRLVPLIEAMAEAILQATTDEIGTELSSDDLGDFTRRYTRAAARRHARSTERQLTALVDEEDAAAAVTTRLDEWAGEENNPSRASKAARRERARSSNALTKAAWAVAGIAVSTWRNVGSRTCPYCTEMDGREAPISGYFLGAGESVAGFTTSGTVGHPPLHDGCDCIMMPSFTSMRRLHPGDLRAALDAILDVAFEPLPVHEHEHSADGREDHDD